MQSKSSVPDEFALLQGCLAAVADPRHARGKVHSLAGVLGLTVLALMAGARSLSDIMRFGQLHPEV
ncbi:MAG: transposase family protein, partial [Chloroflexota bacterium]